MDKVNIQSGIPGLENLFGQGKYIQSGIPGLEYLFGQGKYIQSGIHGLENLLGKGKHSVWNTWIRKLVWTRYIFSLEYTD